MFTGLIEATGTVVSITPTDGATRLILAAPALAGRWHTGDSIAVNGVCLTAIPVPEPTHFAADLAGETLARTTLGSLKSGATVNLELPTPAGSPLGGHVVQGHVDATGKFVSILPLHSDLTTTDWRRTSRATRPAGHLARLHHHRRHQPHGRAHRPSAHRDRHHPPHLPLHQPAYPRAREPRQPRDRRSSQVRSRATLSF